MLDEKACEQRSPNLSPLQADAVNLPNTSVTALQAASSSRAIRPGRTPIFERNRHHDDDAEAKESAEKTKIARDKMAICDIAK